MEAELCSDSCDMCARSATFLDRSVLKHFLLLFAGFLQRGFLPLLGRADIASIRRQDNAPIRFQDNAAVHFQDNALSN